MSFPNHFWNKHLCLSALSFFNKRQNLPPFKPQKADFQFFTIFALIALLSIPNIQLEAQDSTDVVIPCEDGHGICALHQELELLYEESPAFEEQCEENCNLLLEHVVASLNNDSIYNDSLVIPVVFHVFTGCENSIENVSDARLIAAIDKVNRDFQAFTACGDDSLCDVVHPERLGGMNIEFRIAEKDPNGHPTSGITRTKSNVTYLGWGTNPQLKKMSMWPRDQYLNIYIVNRVTANNNSGIAFYPETSHNNPMIANDDNNYLYDGVVMAHWAISPIDSSRFAYDYILSHEIGHWLGLRHIWGDSNGSHLSSNCDYDDFDFVENFLMNHPSVIPNSSSVVEAVQAFNDTPASIGHYIGYGEVSTCVPVDEENTCADVGEDLMDMYDNFMDYTPCAKMFSQGQVLYMKNVLNSFVADRNQLHTPENMAAVFYDSTAYGRAVFAHHSFNEFDDNQGAFLSGIPITLEGLEFSQSTGELPNFAYEIIGLPDGLSPALEIYSTDSATLFLEAAALNHDVDTSIQIIISPGAFVNGGDILEENRSKILELNFIETAGIVYQDLNTQYELGPNGSAYHRIETDFGTFEYTYSNEGAYQVKLDQDLSIQIAINPFDSTMLRSFNKNDIIDEAAVYANGSTFTLPSENLVNGDHLLIGFSINTCGSDSRYGCMRFEMSNPENTVDNCESLKLKDITYSNEMGLESIAGVLPEPVLHFSSDLREGLSDDGTFESVQIMLEGTNANEGFDPIYHGQILPDSSYTILSNFFPEEMDSLSFEIMVLDYEQAVLSIKNPVNLENADDFYFELNLDPNILIGNFDDSNIALYQAVIGVDFVGPYYYSFKVKDQADVNTTSGDYQSYVFILDHLTQNPLVEVGFEYYGDGYIFYSPTLSEVRVEILCTESDLLKPQFFNQGMLDSLSVDPMSFQKPGPGAYYPTSDEPYEGELFFTNDDLANWENDYAYFLLKFTIECGEVYYAWLRMEKNEDGSINTSYISYNTEANALPDLFPTCDASGANAVGDFIWCEGIELGDIVSHDNFYDPDYGYTNFLNDYSTDLERGQTYPLQLHHGGYYAYQNYWYAWIDYNRDGLFSSDSEEMIVDTLIGENVEYEFIEEFISIPTTVEPGQYTLRVVASLYNDASSCGSFTYGEVEDYAINIVTAPCEGGIPHAPGIIVSTDSICITGQGEISSFLTCDEAPEGYLCQWQLGGVDIEGANEGALIVDEPGDYSVYFIEATLNPCISPSSDVTSIIGIECYDCPYYNYIPNISATTDTFCMDSILLSIDSLPADFIPRWSFNGEWLTRADSQHLFVDTAGYYTVYFESLTDSACFSPVSDTFHLVQGDCPTCNICDDGDDCTINDVYDEDCNCVGTYLDSNLNEICDLEEEAFIVFKTKVYLQGALLGTNNELMRDDLRFLGLLPLSEPYTGINGFEHVGAGGGEIIDSALLEQSGEDAIVDWLLIELRSEEMEGEIIATQSVLLQRDGDVVSSNGSPNIIFANHQAGNYFISIRHRNHLGLMTGLPIELGLIPVSIDFSDPNTLVWGAESARVGISNSKMALWAGNGMVIDDKIIFQGLNNETDPIFFNVLGAADNNIGLTNYIEEGYANTDINMDGKTILQGIDNDPTFIFFNILTYPENVLNLPNFIIEEQLP